MKTFGCIRAKMGRTTYYSTKMLASELIDRVGIVKELPEWPDMTMEEKKQREYDIRHIIEDIVPYIIEDPDRFFSSLIIDVCSESEVIEFEPLVNIVKDLPAAYRVPTQDMGFITLSGKERLVALDGQHQLLGLRIAIRGLMGVPAGTKVFAAMNDLKPHPELADEELSIILIEHTDTAKIRKIFNKTNKYAKHTSRSNKIITGNNDIFAVIARRLIQENEPLAPINGINLVNWKSNTLSLRSKHLTTLSALYNIAETLLKDKEFSSKALPEPQALEDAYQQVANFWTICLHKLQIFNKYLELTHNNQPVSGLRGESLLLKPVTQMTLAHTALLAQRKGIQWVDIVEKLNHIDWSFQNDMWHNILVIGNENKQMITGKGSIQSASAVISYMLMGDKMSQTEIEEVKQIIRSAQNNEEAKLPKTID